ncbi:Splicing factor [Tritrichomonas foetus]|uniref:Splicing factor n=1 Tax=Tritrichomonas foetus TaxID=1144522 RepID=A0A1J4KZ55_9EUKA|nr:Splicing factor [Tritrichomonas foetus]|eukprot:OHT16144.1 Splicing factor [Tritrichomonas foetus]
MYRQYRYMPEVNRPCCRATRSREYQAHIDALTRIKTHKGVIDTTHPDTPQTIGRNYKRYEHEKQRNVQIRKDNMRLVGNMDRIAREEHYPRAVPQRPFTLQGQRQKDEMWRITHENHKLLNAVQERKPILNRNDWLMHKMDHTYQVNKNSEYRQTVPMSEIMRQELYSSQGYRRPVGSSYASTRKSSRVSTSRRSQTSQSSRQKAASLEEEVDERVDGLLGNPSSNKGSNSASSHHSRPSSNRADLEEEVGNRADALLGDANKENETGSAAEKQESEKAQSGVLENKTELIVDKLAPEEDKQESKPASAPGSSPSSGHESGRESPKDEEAEKGVLEEQTNAMAGALLG